MAAVSLTVHRLLAGISGSPETGKLPLQNSGLNWLQVGRQQNKAGDPPDDTKRLRLASLELPTRVLGLNCQDCAAPSLHMG